ncbi:MAG: small multi-drug export protein [Candidatus Thermoplasmatota archaeon]|nr:small multi-drug export protein [Candidatus Thermoplasmatota archaeon]
MVGEDQVRAKDGEPGTGYKGPFGYIKRFVETDMERKSRSVKLFQFLFPWVLWLLMAVLLISILTVWRDWGTGKNLLDVWVAYTLPPAGKETLIPLAVLDKEHPIPGLVAGLSTSIVDICFSLFLIWNYDWVKKLPVIGPSLERTEAKGREKVARTRWFGKATFALTTLFVFIPFSGSGGTGGTIFGRVVGMKPYKVLLAVSIGSILGSTGFALAAEQLKDFLSEDSPFISFMSNLNILQVVAIILLSGFVIYTIRNPKRAAERTTRVVEQALDLSEKAVVITEEQRKKVTKATIQRTKETMKAVGNINRTLADIPIDVAIAPMRMMGSNGKKMADDTKMMTRKMINETHHVLGSAVDGTIEFGDRTTDRTLGSVHDLTLEGIGQTKNRWDRTGKVIIMGGEKLEKIMKRKKDMDIPVKDEPEE